MFAETNCQSGLVSFRVIVVGAGLGGLSTAVALARRGHSVLVLESTTKLESVGAGVALPPTTKLWFQSEGILPLNDTACVAIDGFEISRWDTGKLVVATAANPLGKLHMIHHGDLQLAIFSRAQKLPNIEIRFLARVTDINIEESAVFLATGERITGDLVIAADGVKSTIKGKNWPPEVNRAQPTGDAAYRFTLPRTLLEKDDELRNLVEGSWAKRWDGPDGHVVAYPIRNHELFNMVFIHPDDGISDGHGEESWTNMTEKHHVVAAFKGWDPILHKLIELAPAQVPNFRMFIHPPSPIWVKGSTILLGDACHAMLPYLGQGVAQAIEDVTAITAVLSTIETKEQLPVALQAYESSRRGRVEQIQAESLKARQHLHLKDGEAQAARDKERAAAEEAKQNSDVVKMQQACWSWDAAQEAQTVLLKLLNK